MRLSNEHSVHNFPKQGPNLRTSFFKVANGNDALLLRSEKDAVQC